MYRYSNVFITLLASTMIVNALTCIQFCVIITKNEKGCLVLWMSGGGGQVHVFYVGYCGGTIPRPKAVEMH